MAISFDNFPLYDPIADPKGGLSSTWSDNLSSFTGTLKSYLSETGIFVPQVTTALRDKIQSAVNGQLIYNTTTNKFQGFENGAWVNLV